MKNKKPTTKKQSQLNKEQQKGEQQASKTSSNITTTKTGLQLKIIGQKNYIDADTGEVTTADIIHKEAYGDNNFYKLWLADLLGLIDPMAKGKMKIFFYLIDHLKKENYIIAGTTTEISKATKSSIHTVYQTLDYLHQRDIIRTIQKGVYQLNPDLIFKGGTNYRRTILVQYKKLDTIELTKDKQLEI